MFYHQCLNVLLTVKSYTYLLCVAGIIIGSLVLIIMAAMGKLGNQDR